MPPRCWELLGLIVEVIFVIGVVLAIGVVGLALFVKFTEAVWRAVGL